MLVENELKKLKTFNLTYFKGKSHFEEDSTQNYLVFQPMQKYFKIINSIDNISEWKSNGLSNESIKTPNISISIYLLTYFLHPLLDYISTKIRENFKGSCLNQDKVTYRHGTIANIYIIYEISKDYSINSYPTLENCLFGRLLL